MTRVIRKHSRSWYKFRPIVSRMHQEHNECCEICNSCMGRFAEQAENERPGHAWAVVEGNLVFMEDMIVEKRLGRKLEKTETVVHRNGDALDNRDENLEVVKIERLQ